MKLLLNKRGGGHFFSVCPEVGDERLRRNGNV